MEKLGYGVSSKMTKTRALIRKNEKWQGRRKYINICHAISYENQVNDMNKKQSMFAKEYA